MSDYESKERTDAMRSKMLTVAAMATVVLAGCGGGSDEDQVREVASDFTAAFADGDAKRACELMTSDAKQQIVKAAASLGGGTCEKAMSAATGLMDESQKEVFSEAEIAKVTINGTTAEVVLTGNLEGGNDDPMRLAKRGDHWLVDADASAREQERGVWDTDG